MVVEMLYNRKGALAFDWMECGKIYKDVSPPIVIKTIPYKAWQEAKFLLLRALVLIVVEMLRD